MNLHSHQRRAVAAGGSVLVLSAVLVGIGVAVPAEQRYLVITADDAGFSAAVNEATIRAMEQGVVSSASIMVTCPGFDEIADYAILHPEKDFGVHLTLTCESREVRWGPVLKDQVPSLVRPDGSFWPKSEMAAAHATAEDVDRELRAQVRRALDRGIPITHLDHHMWVLLQRPDLLRIYVKLGEDFRLPIRLHRTFTAAECGRTLQDADEYQSLIRPAAERDVPLFDLIETNNYDVPAEQKRAYFLNVLRELQPGISELVIHCSANRPGMLLPGAPDRRAADARVFTSLEIQDEIRRLGIIVVSWTELCRLREAGRI